MRELRRILLSMSSFLFIGGEYPQREFFMAEYRRGDFIACADSGLETALAWKLKPNLVVGDMDSLSDSRLLEGIPGERIVKLERDKDDTDTEYALKLLWQEGQRNVCLVGGGGGRLDHLLALAALFERDIRPDMWLSSGELVICLDASDGEAVFGLKKDDTVSVFPLGADTLGMESQGLAWSLEGLSFPRGGYGISNKSLGPEIRLRTLSGRALIILPYPLRFHSRRESGQRLL